MKTVIAGSRNIQDFDFLTKCMQALDFTPTLIISGGARGVDWMGEWWAQQREIAVKVYPANWSKDGKAAGYIRNEEMAKVCDAVVVLWDGESKGSGHMIDLAKKYNRKLHVFYYNKET